MRLLGTDPACDTTPDPPESARTCGYNPVDSPTSWCRRIGAGLLVSAR